MTTVIKAKRSAVQGKIPTTADLELGELAINTFDGKVFIKRNQNGSESVVNVSSPVAYTTGLVTLSTTTANQVTDTFPITMYRTVKYLIELSTASDYHATEIIVTHNGTTVYTTEYGSVYSSASLGTIDFDISASNVRMLVTPSNVNTTVKFARIEVNAVSGSVAALTDVVLTGSVTEDVDTTTYTTVTGAVALSASAGTVQVWTLTGSVTSVTDSLSAGQYITLMIGDGTAYTIAWGSTVVWVGGSAPTLATTGYTVIEIWKVGTVVYGAYVGAVA